MMAQGNAQAQQDAFADLASWTSSMKKKDETIKTRQQTGKKVLEKVRSKRQKHVVVVDSDGSEVEDDSDEEAEEQERVKMATEYKDQGNEHFKNGNFTEAVNCYTMAQSLDSTNPVYPANRAMASLKLKNWAEAEEDATRALRHDPSYQKAFFRRAQARDQLGKLDGAEMDYKAVLKLEPSNKAAKKQLALLSERLHKSVKFTFERPENCSKSRLVQVPVREVNNKHIRSVGEVGQKIQEEEIKRQSSKPSRPVVEEAQIKTENPSPEPPEIPSVENEPEVVEQSEKVCQPEQATVINELDIKFTKPTSSLDLERDWRSMSSTRQKANYLRFINDAELTARCFTAQLPKYIVDICNVLLAEMTSTLEDARLSHELLKHIAQMPRFQTTMFFLIDSEKSIVSELISALKNQVTLSAQLVSAYTA